MTLKRTESIKWVKELYKQVISLGFFCSVAMELERSNLRSMSGPFDWIITSLDGMMDVIQDRFKDFLNPDYIEQDKRYPYIFRNMKYGIDFYHDFSVEESFEKQLPRVRQKYERRIRSFYEAIKEPTLFVRYIQDQNEYNRFCEEYASILEIFKQYNQHNSLCLIGNSDLKLSNQASFQVYTVEKDPNDVVARKFLEKNDSLKHLWSTQLIEKDQREKNRLWNENRNHMLRENKG